MQSGEDKRGWSGDGLVIGAGPAALAIAAELGERGLAVAALAPLDPATPWENTYGIWAEEVDALGLGHLLSHRWSDTVSYFGPGGHPAADPAPEGLIHHGRPYGLFDKAGLQAHWLERCARADVHWHRGLATAIRHDGAASTVSTADGVELQARLVVDASGHEPVFVRRGRDALWPARPPMESSGTTARIPSPRGNSCSWTTGAIT